MAHATKEQVTPGMNCKISETAVAVEKSGATSLVGALAALRELIWNIMLTMSKTLITLILVSVDQMVAGETPLVKPCQGEWERYLKETLTLRV